MNSGDIIRIKFCQELFSQQLCNIFHVIITLVDGVITLRDLIEAFELDAVPQINSFQSADVKNIAIRVDNLTDGLSFDEKDIDGQGVATAGKVFSPFAAWGVKLIGTNKITRAGGKRFAGINEDEVTDGVIPEARTDIVKSALSFLADPWNYNDPVTPANGFQAGFVIVGRDANGNEDITRTNLIRDVIVSTNVTTQNSRKFGRGV